MLNAVLGVVALGVWLALIWAGYRMYLAMVAHLKISAHSYIVYVIAISFIANLITFWAVQNVDRTTGLLSVILTNLCYIMMCAFCTRNMQGIVRNELDAQNKVHLNRNRYLQFQLDEAERRLASINAIFKNTQMGFIEADSKGTVRLWSDSASSITGLSAKKAVGRLIFDLPLHKYISNELDVIRESVSNRKVLEKEVWIKNLKTKEGRWLLARFTGVYDPKYGMTDPVGYVTAFSDVTVERQQRKEITQKAEALELANSTLERLLSVATHDLQEPTRIITTYAELAEESLSDGRSVVDHLSVVRQQAYYLRELINGLLGYSRLRTSEQERVSIKLSALLDRALKIIKDSPKYADHIDAIELVEDLDMYVDQRLAVQVLVNLITNSIKYRNKDVALKVYINPVVNSKLRGFSVSDNGLGVDESFMPNLGVAFKRFYSKSKIEGTGLGLAMCKMVAERHNGKVTFTTSQFGGLKVSVFLEEADETSIS